MHSRSREKGCRFRQGLFNGVKALRRHTMRNKLMVPVIVIVLLLAAGCGSTSNGYNTSTTNNPPACTLSSAVSATSVSASDANGNYIFTPSCIKVSSGQTVTWTNTGAMIHTATSDSGAPVTFDSGNLSPGQTFAVTFTTPGTIGYHCIYHVSLGMKGTVIVQ